MQTEGARFRERYIRNIHFKCDVGMALSTQCQISTAVTVHDPLVLSVNSVDDVVLVNRHVCVLVLTKLTECMTTSRVI